MVEVALAKDDYESAIYSGLQGLRGVVAQSLSSGTPLLINLGMLGPDFKSVYTHPEFFPASSIFNWQVLQRKRFYRSLMNGTEEHISPGRATATSRLRISHPCSVTVRSCVETKKQVEEVLDKIPSSNEFIRIIIE